MNIYNLTRYSGLFVEGIKVEKPPMPSINARRKPMEVNVIKSASAAKKKLIVKSPRIQPTRNLFQTVHVRPNSTNISNYVESLPNVFNASKCINLSDLKQCLKLRESLANDNPIQLNQ